MLICIKFEFVDYEEGCVIYGVVDDLDIRLWKRSEVNMVGSFDGEFVSGEKYMWIMLF